MYNPFTGPLGAMETIANATHDDRPTIRRRVIILYKRNG